MKEANFNSLKKIYDDFEFRLLKNIKNLNKYFFTQNNEDCYIIEESWYNDLSKFLQLLIILLKFLFRTIYLYL